MSGNDGHWSLRFPALFLDEYIEYADCRIRFTTEAAPDALVSRLHVVAITNQSHVLVCRSEQGWRFLPGGTREPGETLTDLARRELLEEAGATLRGNPKYFAAQIADSAQLRSAGHVRGAVDRMDVINDG